MVRIRFVVSLLPVLVLAGCGDDSKSCADQAAEFPPVSEGRCIITQECNGGSVLVHTCFPPPGSDVGYTLFVSADDQEPLGFVTLEAQCPPVPLNFCSGLP